jgi:peptidoglycan/xylan/chitin deacetylase (PgdA/CDA1 family)
VVSSILVACGSSDSGDKQISWHASDGLTPTTHAAIPPAASSTPPAGVGGETSALPDAPPAASLILSPDKLKALKPNELGLVPVLEYHVITTNPKEEAQFVRLADDMRADLQWLYDHDFYVITVRELIINQITAPAGKRPVVLTFDDGTSSQFRFIKDRQGNLVPDPNSAVGILEAFFAKHPDFGHTAHFAILPYNCFAFPEEKQMPYCDQKIQWLVDHGYEVGNHTMTHANLTDIPTETFIDEVGGPMKWVRERVGDVQLNMSDVLTLPYGAAPDKDLHPDQRKLMREGFWLEGEAYYISAAFLVGANPSPSPASTQWEPLWIPRIQMFDDEVTKWFGAFERGEVPLYVSDGNPATVTVPDPLPNALADQLDAAALAADGKTVVQYDPVTGRQTNEAAIIPAAPRAVLPRPAGPAARAAGRLYLSR